MSELTAKQAAFVSEYMVDRNATQAAIRAGYSAKTAEQGGAQLLRNIKVADAIERAERRMAAKLEVTREDQYRKLELAREMAMQEKQSAAAISAVQAQNKMLGLDEPDKVQHEIKHVEDMTDDELLAIAQSGSSNGIAGPQEGARGSDSVH